MSSSTSQQPAPRFERSQRVRIIANQGGLYHAQIGIVGVIERKRQYRRFGYHTYDVGYQDEKGHDKLVTAVREDDLEAVTGDEASVPENARPVTDSAASVTTAKPTKPSDKLPLFAKGEHITVDPRSELCYETFTRKGAVGVIMRADKAVRGIRRYQVLFEVPHLGGRRATRIREEHLLRAEPPAPSEPPHDDGWGTWDDDAPMKAKEQADDAAYTAAYGDERPSRPVTPAVTPATCDHTWQVYHNHGSHRRCTTCGRHEAICEHDWFLWPDGRYRHCPKCKLSERVPAAQNEVAR